MLVSLLVACGRDKQEEPEAALPVATSWSGESAGGADPHAGLNMGGADPHAGLNMGGADPHAGLNMGGADPHAGLDMGGADPHAGLDMGGADLGGLQPPDPDRKMDPSQFLKGRLIVSKAVADQVTPGSVVFLSVRPIHKATGESLGSPLAVELLELGSLPLRFHLSAEPSLVAGTAFEGDVMIYARVDGDGEASTTLPGDIEGSVMAHIPAEGLTIVLDTVVGAK